MAYIYHDLIMCVWVLIGALQGFVCVQGLKSKF